jgi:hypothetical protein
MDLPIQDYLPRFPLLAISALHGSFRFQKVEKHISQREFSVCDITQRKKGLRLFAGIAW